MKFVWKLIARSASILDGKKLSGIYFDYILINRGVRIMNINIKDRSLMNVSLSLIFAAGLASCGGSSGGDDDDDDPKVGSGETRFGIVSVDEDASGSSGPEVEFDAAFFQVNVSVSVNLIKDSILPALDICEVNADEIGEFEPPEIDGVTASIVTISAGEVLTFMQPSGSYAEITKQPPFMGFTFYDGDSVPGSIPAGLTIDIPGDVFPTFSNVSIPNAGGLVVSSPTGGTPVTPDTTFTWNASSDPDTLIDISTSSFDLSTGAVVVVECVATDDGSFTFPAATKAEMGSGFSGFSADITRTAFKVVEQNGAILIVGSSSSN